MNTFDFEYHVSDGTVHSVEVDFYYETPNPLSTESDWDYQGGLIIDGIRIYLGSKEVFDVDISPTEIAFQFRKYMDDLEIKYVMENNESF